MNSLAFSRFAEVCEQVEGIPGSLETTDIVANFFQEVDETDLEVISHFIMGRVFPAWMEEELGIGPSLLYDAISTAYGHPRKDVEDTLRRTGDIGATAEQLSTIRQQQPLFQEELTIKRVYDNFNSISKIEGKGSQKSKIRLIADLLGFATPLEARYLARLIAEELRIGVGEGIVRDAIANAFDVPADLVERGYMLVNDLGQVAVTAKNRGEEGLEELELIPGRPIKMMLAQIAESPEKGVQEFENPGIEWKYDGARVQIHKEGDRVQIFSRRLENITSSLPDIVSMIRENITSENIILDGETIAMGPDRRPRPFQYILRRFRRKYDVDAMVKEIPLHLALFDVLYEGKRDLIDMPLGERREILEASIRKKKDGSIYVSDQTATSDLGMVEKIYAEALAAGHEGIMLKNLNSSYTPGRRGKNWLKLKPVMETLDLVVIGAQWGEGRRKNLLGSYFLACYEPETGEFLPLTHLGTGITDEQLLELTELFQELIIGEHDGEMEIRPEIVFETGYEEIQKSTKYESGYALRFPRLVRVREDKSAEEADTLERVIELYEKQQ